MVLSGIFYVYGQITDSYGDPVENAEVYAEAIGRDVYSSVKTTDSNGAYSINIGKLKHIINGDTIRIHITSNTGISSSDFILDDTGIMENVDIQLYTDKICVYYDTTYAYLNVPMSMVESATKKIVNVVFNNKSDAQLNMGKMSDTLTLNGVETSDAYDTIETLNGFMDNKRVVTISSFPDKNFNTNYVISDLQFKQMAGYPNIYYYTLTLERKKDRLG